MYERPFLCYTRSVRYTYILRRVLPAFGLLQPAFAVAQNQLVVGTGTSIDFWTVAGRIISFLAATITVVAVAMFMVGALYLVLSGAKEDYKQKGKDYMIGSVISIAVVLGAYAILRTVDYFLS